MKGQQTMVVLTKRQIEYLDKESKRLGISRNEALRRILDSVIDRKEQDDLRNLQDSQQG